MADIIALARELAAAIASMDESERMDGLNSAREILHSVSPMRHHPVDFVRWVRAEEVLPCDYGNPNFVAPPEMRLLEHSITANGYTMPVVTHECEAGVVTVDGHHRRRVCLDSPSVNTSTKGYLPITQIRAERTDEPARIAATIEHNRARGEHRVDQMSELVRMLYQAGWRDNKIQEELGMTADEVLRMKQITGLAEMFASRQYSEAWEPG